MSRLRTAAATDTGYLRVTNQDVALATSDLAAVADGMGGHLGGEVAARIAVYELLETYRRDRTTDGLLAAVNEANAAVYRRSKADRNVRGMGTTLTAAAFIGDEPDGKLQLALVNVGDSRAYLLDPKARAVHRLTEDHSVVEEMVRSGELTPEEAAVHPHRHILTRVIGVEPSIEPDCWELDLEPGSRLLLCSDGLTNELDEQDIANVLADEADADKAAKELVRLALLRGGIDNVTVVVLDVLAGESSAVSDDVIVIPEVVPGSSRPVPEAEAAPITEVVALTPAFGEKVPSAPAPDPVPATPRPAGEQVAPVDSQGSSAVPKTTAVPHKAAAAAAPKGPHGRPMVLVPSTKRRKEQRDRLFTIRVALFVLVFVGVLGSTAGVVVWFDKASFFVGLDHGYVTIFQGRPGGLLWIQPSVVERTTITPADLLASNVVYLQQGMEESSYQAARNLVRSLSLEHLVIVPSGSTTTTTVRTRSTTVQNK
ncbi:MAG: Stp1/IreP family PP2C-type Ser/Thr phosphatase [Acidimicrobiales bacterium]|jgi:PPM family protein phosphatase